ncbi:MAG: RNA polymerase sigma-70 factor [Prolixibacteraceae bacterium]
MVYRIDLLRAGNKGEFEKVYTGFFETLYAISFQYVADRSVAESIVQDSFVRLWEVHERLAPQTNIRNFLYTVTKNLCLNYLRDQKVLWKYLDQVKSDEYDYAIRSLDLLGESWVEYEELKARIDVAIENLPEKLKVVFKMSRFEELKYCEIAEQLNIGAKAVEARMSKALRILRFELKDYLALLLLLH